MKYVIYCRKSSEEEDRQIQSIESQERELSRAFASTAGVEVVGIHTEAQSAMKPGRPVFDALLDAVEKGEIQGIIAWAPDRLARNSIDGGRVIYLLDKGALKDLRFATFSFENTSSGKFMLSILFGQSKYYSDALSENVRRGIRTKLENGWLPNMAKIGYLNDAATRTIVPDPARFSLVREMWDLMLIGKSPRDIQKAMTDRGLRTLRRKREGGRPLALSTVYKIITSPFYAGLIPWRGKLYPGKHPAMITLDEFERVQRLLKRPSPPRPKRKDFAFTGLLRCGECGFAVTAEHKVNRFGSQYTYYHCSKRRTDYQCGQKSVSETNLDAQFAAFLPTISLPPALHQIGLRLADRERAKARALAGFEADAHATALARNETARRNLTKLRIADHITDIEFETERQELNMEAARLQQRSAQQSIRFEPAATWLEFSVRAAKWFREGDRATKRVIIEIVSSNPVLLDQKLRIDAANLFRRTSEVTSIPALRAVVEDVRTLATKDEGVQKSLADIDELIREMNLKQLQRVA